MTGAKILRPSAVMLIAMNLIPLVGVALWGWSVGMLIFLYWAENIVIGVLNIARIWGVLMLKGREFGLMWARMGGAVFMSGFFAVHYGGFCAGHYMFLKIMFDDVPTLASLTIQSALFWSLAGLFISHLFSLIVNFFGRGEYKTSDVGAQMFQPYGRIAVLHVVILIGAALVEWTDNALPALLLLVALKTSVDLAAHLREHKDTAAIEA